MFEEKLSRKERKAAEAERVKEEAEWEAKQAASKAKRDAKKFIEEISKVEKGIIESAAMAKAKGYADIYRQQLSALKVARARRVQAEKFLFQVDTMEKMKSISAQSSTLLASMNGVMGTLGKLTLDKDEMKRTQQNFAQSQRNLEQQSGSIEQFFMGMEQYLPEEETFVDSDGIMESDLEKEISSFQEMSAGTGAGNATVDPDVAEFQKLLSM